MRQQTRATTKRATPLVPALWRMRDRLVMGAAGDVAPRVCMAASYVRFSAVLPSPDNATLAVLGVTFMSNILSGSTFRLINVFAVVLLGILGLVAAHYGDNVLTWTFLGTGVLVQLYGAVIDWWFDQDTPATGPTPALNPNITGPSVNPA
jgi:hypothetical protein